MPPHAGHQRLVAFAQAGCDHLTLILFSKAAEPIPGKVRAHWLRDLFPGVEVIHVTDEGSVDYASEAAWDFWIDAIRRIHPSTAGPEWVFSSETYGPELARRLGARHSPWTRSAPRRRSRPPKFEPSR